MSHKLTTLCLLAGLSLSGAAEATLIDRGGGLIYDDVLNITWLADANYGAGSSYDDGISTTDGRMNWDNAMAWAAGLSYFDSVRGVTYSDWRLPMLNPADTSCSDNFNPGGGFPQQYYGYNCTGGELSHLFVADLGNKAGESVLNQVGDTAEQIANLALFSNVQSYAFWSGTEYAPFTNGAWLFYTYDGRQDAVDKGLGYYAWAVRPGDVAAVPEPATLLLVGLGLAGLGAMRRRG